MAPKRMAAKRMAANVFSGPGGGRYRGDDPRGLYSRSHLQREAVLLFEYEGFTLEEIATIANVDVGTVKSRLHRARGRSARS